MIKTAVVCVSLLCVLPAFAQTTPEACANISLGTNGALNGFVPSATDAWHQDISQAAVDPKSSTIINTSGDLGGAKLHPDFSSIAGGNYGIPYNVVDSSQTAPVAMSATLYPKESDISSVPMPSTAAIEGGSPFGCSDSLNGDRHGIVIDRNKCVVYEMWQTKSCSGAWSGSSTAMWDMLNVQKRPYNYTSVDAAGLSVFEGLIRYDEILRGEINHAIRFTALHTKGNSNLGYFVSPATHAAGSNSTTNNIMGMRIRLRADFDISGYSQTNQIILRAMKKYGMILADNGSNLFFQGTPDARWNDSDLHKLAAITASSFEVVDMGTVYQTTAVPTGTAPKINSFTASASTVAPGAAVTLTPNVTDASYSYIDKVGLVRGAVTVNPTATTTYTLTSRNAYGTTSSSVTVNVSSSATTPFLMFNSIGFKTYGDPAFTVSASSNSPGAITYSVISGPATISGNTVTLTGAGNVGLKASQAASGTYAATSANTSFTVSQATPTLAFVAVGSKTYPSSAFTVSTTTNSGGSISYAVTSGPATISGNTVTLTGPGTVVLTAKQAASGNYTAATATTSFAVTGSSSSGSTTPTLTVPTGTISITYGTGTYTASATSNSPGAITYSIVSGPATINRNSVTPTGIGTVTVKVSQAASGSYTATSKTFSLSVLPGNPKLGMTQLPTFVLGSAPITLSATSLSGAPITYAIYYGTGSVVGALLTPTGLGKVTVTATQAAYGNYTAATAYASFYVVAAQ